MNILALTRYGRLGASSRIRIYQYMPIFAEAGIKVTISPLLSDNYLNLLYKKNKINFFTLFFSYLNQFFCILTSFKFDLIWIEKEIFPNLPPFFEQLLNFFNIKYIVDFDDAIFHNYDKSSNIFKKNILNNKIDKVMSNSRLVMCGNSYLAKRALASGARYVEILPSVVDLSRYSVKIIPPRPKAVIAWIGSPSTIKYLMPIIPSLRILSREFPFQLRIIGAQFSSFGLDIECRSWSEVNEVNDIQDIDIGVMPLLDSPWERGKCGYKLIQYMACGKPVVASPVGINTELVINGYNGYLANTHDDWLSAFRALLAADPKQRIFMGKNGRNLVEEKYQLKVTAPLFIQLLHKVATVASK